MISLEFAFLLALAAFGAGLLASRPLRRWRRRQAASPAGPGEVLPIRLAVFRQLVSVLGRRRAAQLAADLGRPLQFTAQDGEDILLAALFDHKREGFFIEIGAFDGIRYSNSYFFEQLGWRGILVEPLPEQAAACRQNRPGSQVVMAAIGPGSGPTVTLTEVKGVHGDDPMGLYSYVAHTPQFVAKVKRLGATLVRHEVPRRTFGEIAAECGLPAGAPIDFISIDCEGMDFDVLQSIDLTRWQPRLFIIEQTPPPLLEYLAAQGYFACVRLRANMIFSRERADVDRLSAPAFWRELLAIAA